MACSVRYDASTCRIRTRRISSRRRITALTTAAAALVDGRCAKVPLRPGIPGKICYQCRAHIVNYADDFVILSQRCAAEALAWTKAVMTKLGLTLNEGKTSVKDARTERFDFLGYTFGPHCYQRNGNRYLGASPSEKSVKRVKTKIDDVLVPGDVQPWTDVCHQLNGLLRGWSAYFCYGTRNRAYRAIDHHVCERVRHFLSRRHKVPSRGTKRFPSGLIFGGLGVLALDYRRGPYNQTSRKAGCGKSARPV